MRHSGLYCNADDWTNKTQNKTDLFFHSLNTRLSKRFGSRSSYLGIQAIWNFFREVKGFCSQLKTNQLSRLVGSVNSKYSLVSVPLPETRCKIKMFSDQTFSGTIRFSKPALVQVCCQKFQSSVFHLGVTVPNVASIGACLGSHSSNFGPTFSFIFPESGQFGFS